MATECVFFCQVIVFLISLSPEPQLMVVAGPHFCACHRILPLIKVEVESGMFWGRGEGNFRKCDLFPFNFRKWVRWKETEKERHSLPKISISWEWILFGARSLEFKNQQILEKWLYTFWRSLFPVLTGVMKGYQQMVYWLCYWRCWFFSQKYFWKFCHVFCPAV